MDAAFRSRKRATLEVRGVSRGETSHQLSWHCFRVPGSEPSRACGELFGSGAVFNNGALQFVELEQKVEGSLDTYTDLNNPNFARVAEAIGLWARRIERPAALEDGVLSWLEAPGPALLDVVVARNELVMPPKTEVSQVLGTALYSAKAILSGRADDVIDLAKGALTT